MPKAKWRRMSTSRQDEYAALFIERFGEAAWAQVEQAWQWWQATGRPRWDRFGISITPDGQRVWYGGPGAGQDWPLLPE